MKISKDITKDKEAFCERVSEYFRSCDMAKSSPACSSCKNGKGKRCERCAKRSVPYTLSGLCFSLGITKRKFLSLRQNKCLSNVAEMALLKIESYVEQSSYCGNINSMLAKAVLEENFGWGKAAESEPIKVELSADVSEYGQ